MKQNDLDILLETCLDDIPYKYLQIILEAEAIEAEDPEKWANLAKSFAPTAKHEYSKLKTMMAFLKKNAHMDISPIENIIKDISIPNADKYKEIKDTIDKIAAQNPKAQEAINNWDKFWPEFQKATGKKNIMLPRQKRTVPENNKGILSKAIDKVKGAFSQPKAQVPQLPEAQHAHIAKLVETDGDNFRNFFKKSLISNNYRDAARQLKAHMDKDGISHNLDDMVKAMAMWNNDDLSKGISWFFANYNLNPMPLISSYNKLKSGNAAASKPQANTAQAKDVVLRNVPKDWLDTNIKELLDAGVKSIDPSAKFLGKIQEYYTFTLNTLILTEAGDYSPSEPSAEIEYKYNVHGKELVFAFSPNSVVAIYDNKVVTRPEVWHNTFKASGSSPDERKKSAIEYFSNVIRQSTKRVIDAVSKQFQTNTPQQASTPQQSPPSLEPEPESEPEASLDKPVPETETETDMFQMPSQEQLEQMATNPDARKRIAEHIANLKKEITANPDNKKLPQVLNHFETIMTKLAEIDIAKNQNKPADVSKAKDLKKNETSDPDEVEIVRKGSHINQALKPFTDSLNSSDYISASKHLKALTEAARTMGSTNRKELRQYLTVLVKNKLFSVLEKYNINTNVFKQLPSLTTTQKIVNFMAKHSNDEDFRKSLINQLVVDDVIETVDWNWIASKIITIRHKTNAALRDIPDSIPAEANADNKVIKQIGDHILKDEDKGMPLLRNALKKFIPSDKNYDEAAKKALSVVVPGKLNKQVVMNIPTEIKNNILPIVKSILMRLDKSKNVAESIDRIISEAGLPGDVDDDPDFGDVDSPLDVDELKKKVAKWADEPAKAEAEPESEPEPEEELIDPGTHIPDPSSEGTIQVPSPIARNKFISLNDLAQTVSKKGVRHFDEIVAFRVFNWLVKYVKDKYGIDSVEKLKDYLVSHAGPLGKSAAARIDRFIHNNAYRWFAGHKPPLDVSAYGGMYNPEQEAELHSRIERALKPGDRDLIKSLSEIGVPTEQATAISDKIDVTSLMVDDNGEKFIPRESIIEKLGNVSDDIVDTVIDHIESKYDINVISNKSISIQKLLKKAHSRYEPYITQDEFNDYIKLSMPNLTSEEELELAKENFIEQYSIPVIKSESALEFEKEAKSKHFADVKSGYDFYDMDVNEIQQLINDHVPDKFKHKVESLMVDLYTAKEEIKELGGNAKVEKKKEAKKLARKLFNVMSGFLPIEFTDKEDLTPYEKWTEKNKLDRLFGKQAMRALDSTSLGLSDKVENMLDFIFPGAKDKFTQQDLSQQYEADRGDILRVLNISPEKEKQLRDAIKKIGSTEDEEISDDDLDQYLDKYITLSAEKGLKPDTKAIDKIIDSGSAPSKSPKMNDILDLIGSEPSVPKQTKDDQKLKAILDLMGPSQPDSPKVASPDKPIEKVKPAKSKKSNFEDLLNLIGKSSTPEPEPKPDQGKTDLEDPDIWKKWIK